MVVGVRKICMRMRNRYVWVGTEVERRASLEKVAKKLTAKWEKIAKKNKHDEILRENGIQL